MKQLDIGDIHTIPGYCGVFRSVTALTTMIIYLHLRSERLIKKLHWLNGVENRFVVEFSDDGAPESKEETMCIGSLTMWNFGKRAETELSIILFTAKEKDNALSNL